MNKIALAAALGLLLFFTYLTGVRPAYAFAYALSLLFLIAWVWPRLAIRGISLTRRLDPGTPTVGESYEEVIEVSRSGWVPAPWVEIRDLGQIPDYQPGRVISVGGELVSWKSRGVYRRRGWMSFGPTSVSVREPFGLFNQTLKMGNRTTVLVYPRVRPIPDLMTPSAQQVGSSQSLGDYSTGDSVGRGPWPLSLRHGRLMSKTFEQPLTTDLWILLDLDHNVHTGEGEESTVEYAVSLAASMAAQVHSRGRQVGLIANDSKGTILEPHRAVRQDRLVLDYLAVATADGRTPLTQTLAWDRIRRLPRRAIAVITPSADPAWVRLLQSVRGRRSTLIVFYLDVASSGGPALNPRLDLGHEVDLYVVRKGDDFARLMRTRDAIRIG